VPHAPFPFERPWAERLIIADQWLCHVSALSARLRAGRRRVGPSDPGDSGFVVGFATLYCTHGYKYGGISARPAPDVEISVAMYRWRHELTAASSAPATTSQS